MNIVSLYGLNFWKHLTKRKAKVIHWHFKIWNTSVVTATEWLQLDLFLWVQGCWKTVFYVYGRHSGQNELFMRFCFVFYFFTMFFNNTFFSFLYWCVLGIFWRWMGKWTIIEEGIGEWIAYDGMEQIRNIFKMTLSVTCTGLFISLPWKWTYPSIHPSIFCCLFRPVCTANTLSRCAQSSLPPPFFQGDTEAFPYITSLVCLGSSTASFPRRTCPKDQGAKGPKQSDQIEFKGSLCVFPSSFATLFCSTIEHWWGLEHRSNAKLASCYLVQLSSP